MKELVEGLHQALRPAYTEAPTLRYSVAGKLSQKYTKPKVN